MQVGVGDVGIGHHTHVVAQERSPADHLGSIFQVGRRPQHHLASERGPAVGRHDVALVHEFRGSLPSEVTGPIRHVHVAAIGCDIRREMVQDLAVGVGPVHRLKSRPRRPVVRPRRPRQHVAALGGSGEAVGHGGFTTVSEGEPSERQRQEHVEPVAKAPPLIGVRVEDAGKSG